MTIVELDKALTLTINSCHAPFWDNFFFIFSGQLIWLPFFAAVIYALYRQYGRRVYLPLIAFFLVILISDQISSSLIKPLVCRLRPTHDPEICAFIHTVNGYVGGLYGFVSSHAANSFSFALLSSLIFKRWGYSVMAFLWAAVTSYSRIYLGVHFLGDVIVGAAIGLVAAYAIYLLLVRIQRKADVVVNRANKFSIVLIYSVMALTLIALVVLKEHLVFLA